MTAAAFSDDVPVGWSETVADLDAEAAFLARELHQELVRAPGATGVLNRMAPSTVWAHSAPDIDALLDELSGFEPMPEVMAPVSAAVLAASLLARGWRVDAEVDRLRCDVDGAPSSAATQSDVAIRVATTDDLPELRALHVRAFGAHDSADYLPDGILAVPGLQIFVVHAREPVAELIGSAGVRLRHAGALVFGLATTPASQRRGVASALVTRCLSWAAENGAPFAIADVDVPAPTLWHRLGFESTGRWLRFTAT